MSQFTLTQLPDTLLSVLRAGCPALLLTVGIDGFAHTAYTWVVGLDATTLADLRTTITAPEGDSVVLGVSPVGALTSVFVVQLRR